MSLFGSLPPPTGQANKREAVEPPAGAIQDVKRLKEDAGFHQQPVEQAEAAAAAALQAPHLPPATTQQATAAAAPPPPPQQQQDQVAAALRKIASHIRYPKKFVKAAELLRQLFSQDALRPEHGPLAFSALKAAMQDPQQAHDPMLAREYSKLFTAASKHAEVFTMKERSQLDVYGVWAVLRNQLTTDDSFQFNKVVGRLKEMASALPEADEADDEVLQSIQDRAADPDPILVEPPSDPSAAAGGEAEQQQAEQQQGAQQAEQPVPPPAEPAELDPFGLDALMAAQAPPPPPPPLPPPPPAAPQVPVKKRKSVAWNGEEVTAMRRVALLDCIDTCKAVYRNAWARTSVDLLIEHFHKNSERFTPSQRPRLEEFMRFVRDQRRVRKLGPSAKEVARDVTTFEARSSEWSKQNVSARGKLGAGADHKSEMWLG